MAQACMGSQSGAAVDQSILEELTYDRRIFDGKSLLERLKLTSSLPSQARVRQKMRENGWCPHLVDYQLSANRNWLRKKMDLDSKELLETRSFEQTNMHDACAGSSFCKAYNINKETYRPRHSDADCNDHCKDVAVSQQVVSDIIASGNFPTMSIKLPKAEPQTIENGDAIEIIIEKAIHSGRVRPYVAISHVWAHGLGNPRANALPACQIRALARRLSALGIPRFWLDTLSMPVDPLYKKSYQAILQNMTAIYTLASGVLVLDLDLMRTPEARWRSDLCQQIQHGVWAQRSWTLQEALLGRNWIFQLQGDAYLTMSTTLGLTTVRAHVPNVKRIGSGWQMPSLRSHLIRGTIARAWRARPRWYIPMTSKARRIQLLSVWNLLAGRSTTFSDDLCILMANLLDIDADQLAGHQASERLMRVILTCSSVPFSLMCLAQYDQTSKLSNPNAWIPRQITRDLLSGDSGVIRLQPRKQLWSLRVPDRSLLACYEADSTLLERSNCLLETTAGETFIVESLFPTKVTLKPGKCSAYLILDDLVLGDEPFVRGACFWSRETRKSWSRQSLILTYGFPVKIKNWSTRTTNAGCHDKFRITRVKQSIKFRFEPVSGFSRPARNPYVRSFGILTFIAVGTSVAALPVFGVASIWVTPERAIIVFPALVAVIAILYIVYLCLVMLLRRQYLRRFKLVR